YKDGKIKTKSFFTLEFKEKNDDMDKIVDNIDKAMKNSVEYHQISDVEVGSFLSSGIDSSYIVSLAKPDKTFTVGYDNPKFDEISYAKDLSDKLGIENYSKKITMDEYIESFPKIMYYMDEPLADPSAIALYFVSEIASKEVKVVLSGEGADEFFAGYNSYQEELTMQGYMKLPYFLRHIVSNIVSIFPDIRGFNFLYRRGQKLENYNIGLGRVFRDKEAQSIVKIPNQINTKDIVKNVYDRYKDNSTLIQRQMIDYYYWLVNDFLHAVDRNTMMFGLEARTPFLDNKVYEVAKSLPTYAKINKETTKVALRKAASKVIPNEAYKKKKLGFPVPLREWIKTDKLYNIIKEKFNGESAKLFFDTKKINKLLEEHKNGKRDSYKKVWTIYTFLVWYDIYFNEI
ncbi:MAG: asparagine synthase C-terminal domain-containing protein, partial [Bacilli bacterium]|nr:asparagine synthase C-terminal domain-containing protein [Bacilli bacterium]